MMGKRMTQKYLNWKLVPAALCAVALVAGTLVAGTGPVRADDDTSTSGAYRKFFNKMMSNVGLRDAEPDIEYRERPPLVVPPTRDLPQPAAGGSPAAKNAAWPSDSNAGKRRSGKAKTTDGSVIAGEKADTQTPQGPTAVQHDSGGMWKSISTMGGVIGTTNEQAQFVHEPSRGALTDPPAGYRTPSPTQPYGIIAEKAKTSDTDKQVDLINGNPNAERR